MPYVYLPHLGSPIGNHANSRAMASHYLGHVIHDLPNRMWQHIHGQNYPSRVIWSAAQQGISVRVARVWWAPWPAPWLLEHGLKALKRSNDLCPICNPNGWSRHGVDYEHIIWKGIRRIQGRYPAYVPPSDYTIRQMAYEACHMDAQDAMDGLAPAGRLIDSDTDPFSTWLTDEDLREVEREERRQEMLAMRRRHHRPVNPVIEPPYIPIDGDIAY